MMVKNFVVVETLPASCSVKDILMDRGTWEGWSVENETYTVYPEWGHRLHRNGEVKHNSEGVSNLICKFMRLDDNRITANKRARGKPGRGLQGPKLWT